MSLLVHLGEDLWVDPDAIAALRPMARERPPRGRPKAFADVILNDGKGTVLHTPLGVTPTEVVALIRAERAAEHARTAHQRSIEQARAIIR